LPEVLDMKGFWNKLDASVGTCFSFIFVTIIGHFFQNCGFWRMKTGDLGKKNGVSIWKRHLFYGNALKT